MENRRAALASGSADSGGSTLCWTTEEMATAQDTDLDIGRLKALVSKDLEKPSWESVLPRSKECKTLWHQWERLKVIQNVLYRRWETAEGCHIRWQLVLPSAFRNDFLKMAHTGLTGGHLGRRKTEMQVSLRAYWPAWRTDVDNFILRCNPCAQYLRGGPPRQVPLQPMVAGAAFERISIDITGKHPRSRRGNEYILTLIDHFSKWSEAFAIRDHTATTVARILVTEVFTRFGCPRQILSDQGPEFQSELLHQICQLLQIDKIRTSPYKASTNAAVERYHRTLNSMLAKVVAQSQKDWDTCLPFVVAAYRASPHSATNFSPNYLLFGAENIMPLDLVMGPAPGDEQSPTTYNEYVEEMKTRMEDAYKTAREHLKVAAERRKMTYDARVKSKEFAVGDFVWYYYPRRYTGKSPKWQMMYTGPHLIVRKIPPSNYVIQRSARATTQVVHADKLKFCYGETPKSWLRSESTGSPTVDEAPLVEPPTAKRKTDIRNNESHEQIGLLPDNDENDAEIAAQGRPSRHRKMPAHFVGYKM